MPFQTTEQMLQSAQKGGYAIGAFNMENMEMAQAIVAAAQNMRSPVILQTTPSTVRYASVWQFKALVKALCRQSDVPVALHLDHGDTYALAVEAIMAGYSSVMIDGSLKPYAENVDLARRVVDIARPEGIPVEAELGCVGGKEDGHESKGVAYTNPETAMDFVLQTGISSLAVAIGTAHGIYAAKPVLDIRRLRAIRKHVSVPLVLHGASGLSEEDLRACVAGGICKVNFATELRMAYSDGVRKTLSDSPQVFDPKVYGGAGKQRVQALVERWMLALGCAGKA